MWPFKSQTASRLVEEREHTRKLKGSLAEKVVTLERRRIELDKMVQETLAQLDKARQ